MASQAQIDANRRNAQSSTGPKTPEGKASVSRNALQHGLRSNIYKQPSVNSDVFDQLLADLIAEHRPQTVTEEAYVERMALCLHKLAFLESLQNECLFDHSRHLDVSEDKALVIYWNQQERLERAFDRALSALHRLRKERRAAQPEATPEQPTVPSPEEAVPPPQPAAEPIRCAAPDASPDLHTEEPAPLDPIPEKLAS